MNPTVLIVEDEVLLREATAMDLEDLGFAVIGARDAAEALAMLEDDRDVALLFTDIRMPGEIDGWELARRARGTRPALKVIYATGSHDDAAQMVEGGVVLQKPYRLDDLRAALGNIGLAAD